MNFKKLKEIIDSIPEEFLDAEVELQFIYETKATTVIKRGNLNGIIFEDNYPLKLIGIEGYERY